MTLKEIKTMFAPGQIWTALNSKFPTACGQRAVKSLHTKYIIWEILGKKSYMDWPKAAQIIEARPGHVKFNFPLEFGGHTVTLTKIC